MADRLVATNDVIYALGYVPVRSTSVTVASFADSNAVGDGVADDAPVLNAWLATLAARGVTKVAVDSRRYLIDSTDLAVPYSIGVIGPWGAVRGEDAIGYDYSQAPGSFILNPARTIRVGHSSCFRDNLVRRKGLLPATTVANMVANHSGKAGTGITIGQGAPTVSGVGPSDDVVVDNNFIVGFNRAIESIGCSRAKIRDNKFDCTNGIHISSCYDWSEISGNEGWNFLSGHNPLFNASCVVPISSSSIVGGKRRFITAASHGFTTGWPILITDSHVGAGIVPCWGVSPVTVIDTVTFDLETASGLTTAMLGLPSGPGTGTGTGGLATVAVVLNYGVAYRADSVDDWGNWHDNDSWGWAIGSQVDSCSNVTFSHCGHDNFFQSGFWGAIGFQTVGSAATTTFQSCQVAASTTGWSLAASGNQGGNSTIMLGCSSWGMSGSYIDLEAGDVTIVGSKFADSLSLNPIINVAASAGTLELIGVKGSPRVQNSSANPVRIKGGDWGYDTKTVEQVAAAGTTQATATPLNAEVTYLTAVSSGTGVRLPNWPVGTGKHVYNPTATNVNIYPDNGSQIGGGSANAAVTQGTGLKYYFRFSQTVWLPG